MRTTSSLFATAPFAALITLSLRCWQSGCGIAHAVLVLLLSAPQVRRRALVRWPRGTPDADGRVILLRPFFTAAQVRARLADALAVEARTANQHQADAQYWGPTGAIELRAIDEIQDLILSLRPHTAHGGKFAALCHAGLGTMLAQWRADSGDPDGFGLGTIHSVRRALELRGDRDD
ncbi:MAG: hypothetical protein ACEQSK_13385 [Sphingomonadaceae bacterium]